MQVSHLCESIIVTLSWKTMLLTVWDFPVTQTVKSLPAMQETWVRKIPWRRVWPSTPVFLPGESHGQRSPVGYSPWGLKESDTTERLTLLLLLTVGGASGKEPTCWCRRPLKRCGFDPLEAGRSTGEVNGNPLQYSCLENLMDREAWWATVHAVSKSQTGLKQFNMQAIHLL